MNLSVKEKQDLLAISNLKTGFRDASIYEYWVAKTGIKKWYSVQNRFDLDQQQREYFLQQQMKTIQEELSWFLREMDEMLWSQKTKMGWKTQNILKKNCQKMRPNESTGSWFWNSKKLFGVF
jgi:ATP-dependent Lon protease